jgi:SNF2 family DNA or RNA helicase
LKYFEESGRLFAQEENGDIRLATISLDSAIWLASPDLLENISLIGFPTIRLRIELQAGQLVLVAFLMTEVGELDVPKEFSSDWEICVTNNFLVPIRKSNLDDLFNLLKELGIQLHKKLSKSQVFRLIEKTRIHDFALELPENLAEHLLKSPASAEISDLQGTPYPYQSVGINWLSDYFNNGIGALLCDEMGLGKTYQALGLMAHVSKTNDKPILVCCPATLTGNWISEIEKFLPSLKPFLHFGNSRASTLQEISNHLLILTTYDILIRDFPILEKIEFALIICDEAQALKNRLSQRRRAIKSLKSEAKVLVTGTPIENSLKDLWSLSDIVYPGLLGTYGSFESLIDDNPLDAKKLGKLASPLLLRREVKEVAQDLPPLVIIDEVLNPTSNFAQAYEEVRLGLVDKTANANFLTIMGRLTELCCYPGLVIPEYRDDRDAKFIRLHDILAEIAELAQDKVIIFSTFTHSINMVFNFVNRHFGKNTCAILNGSVPPEERQKLVDEFNSKPGFAVLVINPKAGGAGLNITGANHVIHFNRQWNPAIERQATARAYRRKQEKTVFVHRFFYQGTIEEVINDRIIGKEELSEAALENALSEDEEIFRSKAKLITPLKLR